MDADMVDATDDDVTKPEDAVPGDVVAETGRDGDLDLDDERASEVEDLTEPGGIARPVTDPVESLNQELNEFKNIALRLQADFDNYRKRVASQQADEIDRATGRLVTALLPVLDACEAAFSHGADGVEPIWSSLIGALQKQGLEALDLDGTVFDPTQAEAVAHEPGDSEHPVVSEVLRTGYLWKGKVLRPAMVKVRG